MISGDFLDMEMPGRADKDDLQSVLKMETNLKYKNLITLPYSMFLGVALLGRMPPMGCSCSDSGQNELEILLR